LAEKERICSAGGSVVGGRVNGELGVARSFGNKFVLPFDKKNKFCLPQLFLHFTTTQTTEFLLQAMLD
jgi:hypothetical protein